MGPVVSSSSTIRFYFFISSSRRSEMTRDGELSTCRFRMQICKIATPDLASKWCLNLFLVEFLLQLPLLLSQQPQLQFPLLLQQWEQVIALLYSSQGQSLNCVHQPSPTHLFLLPLSPALRLPSPIPMLTLAKVLVT